MSFEIQQARRFAEEADERRRIDRERTAAAKTKPAPKLPTTASRELHTLADPKASDSDKLRAWLRVGMDLGMIEIRDASRVGMVTR